ncbi:MULTISPECIES: cyclase family protein [unclassified Rathayibacter]|uniref:cyclase family protein n=1 Tax=unclassified Rathayibacter TaxID=2609250 RepID=UPI001FB7B521|nr:MULTISPECIES: cyclase family protein [unclassified Rathayibacter]
MLREPGSDPCADDPRDLDRVPAEDGVESLVIAHPDVLSHEAEAGTWFRVTCRNLLPQILPWSVHHSSGHVDSTGHPMTRTPIPDNRGRWGADDDLGTLNLIDDAARRRAAEEVRTGRWASLALPVAPASMLGGPFAPPSPPSPPVQQALLYTGTPPMGMSEVLVVTPHHPAMTHLDAFAHLPVEDGVVYPGRPVGEAVTAGGVQHGSTTSFAAGIVTRGVLLDLAPQGRLPAAHAIIAADLDAAEDRAGVALQPGDALVVRSGWGFSWNSEEQGPGMTVDAVTWMHDRGVALYAGDVGDSFPPLDPEIPMPMHMVALARLGMPLIDSANVEQVSALCAELSRSSFLLSVAPPRLLGLTGVPVNPIAVF